MSSHAHHTRRGIEPVGPARRARTARIVAGQWKNQRLAVPAGVRATSEKVREALFDIVAGALAGARVLDLFAGSGALGVEAASRGAAAVAWVERDPVALRVLRANVERTVRRAPEISVTILAADVGKALRRLGEQRSQFDLVLLDPPFDSTWAKKSLSLIIQYVIVAADSIVVAEHHHQQVLPDAFGPLRRIRYRRHGHTVLSVYHVTGGIDSR